MSEMTERVARAMAEVEGDGWGMPWPHWLTRARAAIAAVREHVASHDLVLSAELGPGRPVSWNAMPAVLEIFDTALEGRPEGEIDQSPQGSPDRHS